MKIVAKENLKYSFRKIREWVTDAISRHAVPQFDVITPKGTHLCRTYKETSTPFYTLRDRPVGLRFSTLADPGRGWDVKVYVYNTRKGKKYVELMSFGLEELEIPFAQDTSMFRTLPSSVSLMNLLMHVWTPFNPNTTTETDDLSDSIKAAAWLTLLDKGAAGRAWNLLRYDRQSPPITSINCAMRWSASFGIRIISRDGLLSSDMKTFRVGVLSNPQSLGASTYSFSMKNKK